MSSTEYHKIEAPFFRHTVGDQRGKFDFTRWFRPEFELLRNDDWTWTEKLNGTNTRIIWDGHKVRVGGRTDSASMPVKMVEMLQATFTEELLEQTFNRGQAVLYGETVGPGITKGSGNYGKDLFFALFDVRLPVDKTTGVKADFWWLKPGAVRDVSLKLGIEVAPEHAQGPIGWAMEKLHNGLKSAYGDFWAEGLVGRPPLGLYARDGERMLMKIKHEDLYQTPFPSSLLCN